MAPLQHIERTDYESSDLPARKRALASCVEDFWASLSRAGDFLSAEQRLEVVRLARGGEVSAFVLMGDVRGVSEPLLTVTFADDDDDGAPSFSLVDAATGVPVGEVSDALLATGRPHLNCEEKGAGRPAGRLV